MWIEQIEIKKKGVGWIVLLAYCMVTALPALVLALRRFSVLRLRNVPQMLLFGKIPLGNSIVWAIFPIVIGTGMCCAYFAGEGQEAQEIWIFLLVGLPLLATGIALAVYWPYHRAYKEYLDRLLNRISKDPELFLLNAKEKVQGIEFGDKRFREALYDLQSCGIIALEEHDKRHFTASIIAPELVCYLNTIRKAHEKSQPRHTWTCSGCGASNTTVDAGRCEYCGTGEKGA